VACPGDREGLVKELAIMGRSQLATCLHGLGRHAEAEALALHIIHAYPTGIPPREILDSHLSALRKLTSVGLLRKDYEAVKQHCRRVSGEGRKEQTHPWFLCVWLDRFCRTPSF
jgi:hypothetical protein